MRRYSALALCLATLPALGADWPHPRGPAWDGRLEAPGTFPAEGVGLRLAWRVGLGSGYSGIVVARGRAVTAFSDAAADWVAAFDTASGKELWRHRLGDRHAGHDGSDDGPLSSPVASGETVVALDPSGRLVALGLADGTELWSRNLAADFGAKPPDFGFTTSPLVAGNVVVVQAGGPEGKSVVGLDLGDGKTLWTHGDEKIDYQSPALIPLAGTTQLVAIGRGKIRALAPDTGRLLWEHALGEQDWSGSAQPSFAGPDRFVAYLGGNAVGFGVARNESGYSVTELYRSNALGQNYAPPVYHDGHLYGFRGQVLTCIDAATGERVWRSRPPGGDGLILVDGNLVIFGAQGNVVVAAATPRGYEERARAQALDGSSLTWPSFADGRVFVRNLQELAAVEVTRGAPAAAAAPSAVAASAGSGEFGRWLERVAHAPDRAALVDELYQKHEQLPIVEGDRVHFLWRGAANDVGIAGSMLDSEAVVVMQRVEGTDLFYRSFELEPHGRWEYSFQLDFERWVTDPRNPRTVPAVEGPEPSSELVAPGYTVPAHVAEAQGPRGTLESFTLSSKVLGSDKEIRVWLPAGYAGGKERYALLVVNDGTAWLERGSMANSLDNLVGKEVAPLVAAFVPAADQWWLEAGGSRTADYARMLATELVPALEARYRLKPEAQARGLVGLRFYALTAAYTVLAHPDVFRGAALQSAYLGLGFGDELEGLIQAKAAPGARFYLDWNRYDEHNVDRDWDFAGDSRRLAALLEGGGHAPQGGEVLDSRGWGGWRNRLDRMLRALFPARAE